MRILAVGNMYPPHHYGGYETVWQGVMRRARAAGHGVRVVTSDYLKAGDLPEQDPDVHRRLSWYWSWSDYRWRALNPVQRWQLERWNAAELGRHLADFQPHVVTWWPMGGMSLSLIEQVRRRDYPSVLVVHDDWLVYGPRADGWLRLWSRRRRALGAIAARLTRLPTRFEVAGERVLFNSMFIERHAEENGQRIPNSAVVTPGIEPEFLHPAPEQEWRWRLLCVGRIDRQKGVDTAIAAMAHLPPQSTLTIVGSGDQTYAAQLKSQVADLGLEARIEFRGPAGPAEMPGLYAQSDVVVFPVRWEEPWGLVPLEAMGIGRPVVSTARGGSREYLRDGENALVFEADDPGGLADRVRQLAGDVALRRQLRKGGTATANAHTARAFEEGILDELLAAGAAA